MTPPVGNNTPSSSTIKLAKLMSTTRAPSTHKTNSVFIYMLSDPDVSK
uniref:Uncharacterized protein n=1 Tax=Zea mays TaxID=4577 RepID=B4FSD6_MAIZE|nr:unknown [Zea mays]